MRRHEHWVRDLPLFAAGVLSEVEARSLEMHLRQCAQCQMTVAEWRAIAEAVRTHAQNRVMGLPLLGDAHQTALSARAVLGGAHPRYWGARAVVGLPAFLLALLLAATLLWPAALPSAAKGFSVLVRKLVLGPHSTVQQLSLEMATPTRQPTVAAPLLVERMGDYWVVTTPIGSVSSPASPSGRDAAVHRYTDLGALRTALPFPLRLPAYLPEGYTFQEAVVTPLYRAILAYRGPEDSLIILQLPVGRQPDAQTGPAVRAVVEMLTDEPVQPVRVGEREAAWVGKRALMWEADDVNYVIGGRALALDEIIRIAESLQ